jgi:cyclopropane-fatty-acyl-phospholipid synthase
MFEHVGRARLPEYFGKIRRLLRPGGLLMNHGITAGGTQHHQLGVGMGDFIEKYIFPGGELLHTSSVLAAMADAGLEMVDTENLRPHYARTLWAWSDALEAQLGPAQQVLSARLGGEQGGKVLRAYRIYLAGCAMGFEQGWMALHQMLATKPSGQIDTDDLPGSQSDYPFSREHMYQPSS